MSELENQKAPAESTEKKKGKVKVRISAKDAARKNAGNIILSFILTLILLAFTFLITPGATIFNRDFYLIKMSKIEFSNSLANDIQSEYQSLAIPGGISQDVAASAVDSNRLNYDLYVYITRSLENKEHSISRNELQAKIYDKFIEYAKTQTPSLSDEDTKSLNNMAAICADYYITKVTFPLVKEIGTINANYKSVINASLIVLGVLFLIVTFILFKTRTYKHRAFRFFMSSFMATALTLGIIPAILLIFRPYSHLVIQPEYFYKFIMSCIDGLLLHFLIAAGIFLFIALNLIIPYKYLFNNASKK